MGRAAARPERRHPDAPHHADGPRQPRRRPPRQQTGLLYRLEETDTFSALLVQAAQLVPARLPAGYGQAAVKSLTPMFSALRKGLGVRYRIVLNPAKRERLSLEEKGKRGRIMPLSGPDADHW